MRKKKSILRNRFFGLAILILVAVGGIFYLIFLSPVLKIKEIQVLGNQEISSGDVQNIAKKILSEGDNFFLIDKKAIAQEILSYYPKIANVSLKSKFPDELIIEIEERQPVAVFCQSAEIASRATSSEGFEQKVYDCFFLAKDGIIFKSIFEPALEIDPKFSKIQNLSLNDKLKLGDKAIEGEEIIKILEIESELKGNFNLPIEEFLLVHGARLNVKIKEGWEAYFDLKEDISWQLTKIDAVLENEIPPERRRNLEYIDLRFGNLAPFKYKD